MSGITSLTDDALIAFDNLQDSASNLFSPTIRLGVTGLSRAGKTVFISSLVHNLVHGGRLALFEPYASGRISKSTLKPQPSMDVPRFQYENHIKTLVEKRLWPDSTKSISQLRLVIEYESASAWSRQFGAGSLNIDIVDYPGEWLLDLPLLGMSYEQWSAEAIELTQKPERATLSAGFLNTLSNINLSQSAKETDAVALAKSYTQYLLNCRNDDSALSMLPPGRFLMPGDLEDSPALTFAPLDINGPHKYPNDSLLHMMAKRFEAYKDIVVRPFFREHFARLDRQIVLVDALQAINAGPKALKDLEHALGAILKCFKIGNTNWINSIFSRKIDRILFAATKADHLHHQNHDRMELILKDLVKAATERVSYSGAKMDVVALAAVRATKEAIVKENGEEFPVIVGTPLAGETIDGKTFDGKSETAIFPGDLPTDPSDLFEGSKTKSDANNSKTDIKFVRFRPPQVEETSTGAKLSIPHIRLDKALNFLIGDQLA